MTQPRLPRLANGVRRMATSTYVTRNWITQIFIPGVFPVFPIPLIIPIAIPIPIVDLPLTLMKMWFRFHLVLPLLLSVGWMFLPTMSAIMPYR